LIVPADARHLTGDINGETQPGPLLGLRDSETQIARFRYGRLHPKDGVVCLPQVAGNPARHDYASCMRFLHEHPC
jgi:hypothetical protein